MNIRIRTLCLVAAWILLPAGVGFAAVPPPPPAMLPPGGAPAEESTDQAVRIIPGDDIIYLHDGTQVVGTVLFVGQKAVIYHNSEGEGTIPREKVLRVQYRGDTGTHKAYKVREEEGHVFLTNIEEPQALLRKFARKQPARPAIMRDERLPDDMVPGRMLPSGIPLPGLGGRGAGGGAGDSAKRREALRAALRSGNPAVLKNLPANIGNLDLPPDLRAELEKLRDQ